MIHRLAHLPSGLLFLSLSVSGCSVVSTTAEVATNVVRTGAEVTATAAQAGAAVASTGVKTAATVGAGAASATVAAGAAARSAAAAAAGAAVSGTVAIIDLAQRAESRAEARAREDEIARLTLVSQGGGRFLAQDGRVLRSLACEVPAGTPAVWVMLRDGRHVVRVTLAETRADTLASDGMGSGAPIRECADGRFAE